MKRICSFLLVGVALVAVASCGNKGKKSEAVAHQEVVEEVVEDPSVVKLYSIAYDGYTNVRQSASSKSKVLGKLRNGKEYVVFVGEDGNWIKVEYNGQVGYVYNDQVGKTPAEPVTVDVDASWIDGCWVDEEKRYEGGHLYYLTYSNGRFTEYHEYESEYGVLCHGKWRFEGDELVLIPVYVTDGGDAFGVSRGDVEAFQINKAGRKLGNMTKVNINASYEARGGHCVDKEMFNYFKEEANKYVQNVNAIEAGSNPKPKVNKRAQEINDSDYYYDEDEDEDEDEDLAQDNEGSEDWDALLTSFEEYVDEYISFAKKAAKGDVRAIAKCPSLLKKAEALEEDLDKAEGELSASQLARYNKISSKMLKAVEEISEELD